MSLLKVLSAWEAINQMQSASAVSLTLINHGA